MNKIQLYIKTHNYTGLKYFGKHKISQTSVCDYPGSGTDWGNHLQKYGDDCLTYVLGTWSEDDPRLEAIALSFSATHDIVQSSNWANMMMENGHDGGDTSKWIDYKQRSLDNNLSESARDWCVNNKDKVIERGIKISKSLRNFYKNGGKGSFSNNTHSEESKLKISEKMKGHKFQAGKKNSQYGTIWINNGIHIKKIQKEHFEKYKILGYTRGRKLAHVEG